MIGKSDCVGRELYQRIFLLIEYVRQHVALWVNILVRLYTHNPCNLWGLCAH